MVRDTRLNWRHSRGGGNPGHIDLTAANAYYTFNAMMMNVARTALPAGVKAELAPFPK